MKKIYFSIFCLILSLNLHSQEALKSVEEDYYDFLSLTGKVERPTLNYRTLSDSEWNVEEDAKHPWKNNNLGSKFTLWSLRNDSNWFTKGLNCNGYAKIYGPEWFSSYNTNNPYGQNDGALWQGRGYNTSLTAGARFEGFGFELTLKPQVCFSENRSFDLMPAAHDSEFSYFWAYTKNMGCDAPQRFGDESFWTYDWGDSEIRWTWYNFTAGFGTETIWLGPAYVNSLLHSNNAPTYPKFDIGLRKTRIVIPGCNYYIGDIEGRVWIGRLSESDYFDNYPTNDHNQFSGFSFAYSPSFLPGLTLGANKVCLSKWDKTKAIKYLNIFYDTNDDEDQKIEIFLTWLFTPVKLNIYGSLGVDDYQRNHSISKYINGHYWHSMTYTVGLRKAFELNQNKNIFGLLKFEWNDTQMSQDFQLQWTYNFGFHHIITQGYTNKGQWIGSGIGYGGLNQYLGYEVMYPKGSSELYIYHFNPDNNYIYSKAVNAKAKEDELERKYFSWFNGNMIFGAKQIYFVTKDFALNANFGAAYIVNPKYNYSESRYDEVWNFHLELGLKYNF